MRDIDTVQALSVIISFQWSWSIKHTISSVQSLSLCPTLWPHGLQHARPPCPSHLLELTQTHVHWVSDAVQPSHPLSSPPPHALSLSSSRVFSNESALLIRWPASASVLPMNIQDWSPLGGTVGSPCSPRDSQESSPTPQFKSINSSALSFLYSPTLTSIHDHWINHSFD